MRIVSRRALREFWADHADAEGPLNTWFAIAAKAKWQNFQETRRTYGGADVVGGYTVFNIKGNAYRLIAKIEYSLQIIFIKCMLTHAEYDKDYWK